MVDNLSTRDSDMRDSDMRRFLMKIVVFIYIIIVVDICLGILCDFLREHARSGNTRQFHDLLTKSCHDILVFGSSRARHHYDPNIMEQILKADCYNAGYDGNGIILAYPIIVNILERHKPQLLVYDITSVFDLQKYSQDKGNTRYISMLKPYYRMTAVGEMIRSVSFNSNIYLHSAMYRYNSRLIPMMMDCIFNMRMDNKGFSPLSGMIKNDRQEKQYKTCEYDLIKIHWMCKLASLKNEYNLNMVWVLSPFYFSDSQTQEDYRIAYEIAAKYNIPLMDYYLDSSFSGHCEYFRDTMHMNELGAHKFSERVSKDIKSLMN